MGGALHARRRHGGRHLYIRAVFDNERYAAVVLQIDAQIALSATPPVVMADTTFHVVVVGSAKEGVVLPLTGTTSIVGKHLVPFLFFYFLCLWFEHTRSDYRPTDMTVSTPNALIAFP